VLLLAIGSMVYLFRGVPGIIRNTDRRVGKPHFDEGRIENGRYINDSIGWEMAIPEGWELGYTRSGSENRYAVGLLEEYGATDSLIGRTKELVSFGKGRINKLVSTVEPANGASDTDVIETMLTVMSMMDEEFRSMGMKSVFDHPQRETVGGKVFYTSTAEIEIVSRQTKHWMTFYSGLVGDHLLSVTMSYSDPQNKFELLNAWRGSVFKDTEKTKHESL
jgi:hypothetical protein